MISDLTDRERALHDWLQAKVDDGSWTKAKRAVQAMTELSRVLVGGDASKVLRWADDNPGEVWRLDKFFDEVFFGPEFLWTRDIDHNKPYRCARCYLCIDRAYSARGYGPRTVFRCERCRFKWRIGRRVHRWPMSFKQELARFDRLIDGSSLGTPSAKAIRALVPDNDGRCN